MEATEEAVRKRALKEVKGVEVKLLVAKEKIIDNLSRIGIVNRQEKKLFPSCYLITTEDDRNFICHFKDLLKIPSANDVDHRRRNTAAWLLDKWGLIKILQPLDTNIQKRKLFVLTKEQLDNEGWEIVHKYHYFVINKKKEVQ